MKPHRLCPGLALIGCLMGAEAGPQAVPMRIGAEYAMPGVAARMAETGLTALKHYPEHVAWDRMQRSAEAPLDFTALDRLVRESHSCGFLDLMLALKPQNRWASRNFLLNFAPQPRYWPQFERWISATVERYDGDGREDMPGLRRPVRWFEIGTEFSTYEPEPTTDYLDLLRRAAASARAASPEVRLMHAAFLTTTVFAKDPPAAQYERAFEAAPARIMHKKLADIRRVLDHPEWFDAANIHALGEPEEIEPMCRWLRWEMARRKYDRPIIISDTMVNPLIAWGPATRSGDDPARLGLLIPPAREEDRPALAATFRKLTANDRLTVAWARERCAADVIKMCIVAASQKVAWINTAYIEDLAWLKLPLAQAGAGLGAWSGMLDTQADARTEERRVRGVYPPYVALRRVVRALGDVASVTRVSTADQRVYLYRLEGGGGSEWVGWLRPGRVNLPGTPTPSAAMPTDALPRSLLAEHPITGRTIPAGEPPLLDPMPRFFRPASSSNPRLP